MKRSSNFSLWPLFNFLSICIISTNAHSCSYGETASCDSYVYISDGVSRTQTEAKAYCDANYDGLASITTQEELTCALSTAGANNPRPWIGIMSDIQPVLHSDSTFSFVDPDGRSCPLSDGDCLDGSFWEMGEPHRCSLGTRCTRLTSCRINNDIECEDTLDAVLCNKAKYVTDGIVKHFWDEAEALCQSRYDTHLASIHSEEDYDEAWRVISKAGLMAAWIGLNDRAEEGNWVWSDGTDCMSDNGHCTPFWTNIPNNIDDFFEYNDADCCFMYERDFADTSRNIQIELNCGVRGYAYLCNAPEGNNRVITTNPAHVEPINLPKLPQDGVVVKTVDISRNTIYAAGFVLFALINNVFICYWCVCKKKTAPNEDKMEDEVESYEKVRIVLDDNEKEDNIDM